MALLQSTALIQIPPVLLHESAKPFFNALLESNAPAPVTAAEVVAAMRQCGYAVMAEETAPRGGVTAASIYTAGVFVIFYADLEGLLTQIGHILMKHQVVRRPAAQGHFGYSDADRHQAADFARYTLMAAAGVE